MIDPKRLERLAALRRLADDAGASEPEARAAYLRAETMARAFEAAGVRVPRWRPVRRFSDAPPPPPPPPPPKPAAEDGDPRFESNRDPSNTPTVEIQVADVPLLRFLAKKFEGRANVPPRAPAKGKFRVEVIIPPSHHAAFFLAWADYQARKSDLTGEIVAALARDIRREVDPANPFDRAVGWHRLKRDPTLL
jgi:hypothetical protein